MEENEAVCHSDTYRRNFVTGGCKIKLESNYQIDR